VQLDVPHLLEPPFAPIALLEQMLCRKVKPVAQIVQQPTRRAPLDVVLVTPISGHWSVAFR